MMSSFLGHFRPPPPPCHHASSFTYPYPHHFWSHPHFWDSLYFLGHLHVLDYANYPLVVPLNCRHFVFGICFFRNLRWNQKNNYAVKMVPGQTIKMGFTTKPGRSNFEDQKGLSTTLRDNTGRCSEKLYISWFAQITQKYSERLTLSQESQNKYQLCFWKIQWLCL